MEHSQPVSMASLENLEAQRTGRELSTGVSPMNVSSHCSGIGMQVRPQVQLVGDPRSGWVTFQILASISHLFLSSDSQPHACHLVSKE